MQNLIWQVAGRRYEGGLRPALVVVLSAIGVLVLHTFAADGPTSITLSPTTSPVSGQPGITVLNITGNNFPSGTISSGDVKVTLQPTVAGSGPAMTAKVQGVTSLVGSSRRITFQILPGNGVSAPTAYQASVSGSTSTEATFTSANSSALTVNPPPAILSVVPSSGLQGQQLTLGLTSQFTDFLQGSTVASFGPGISVGGAPAGALGPVAVNSPTSATIQLAIDHSAAPGTRTVTVATGVQQASLSAGFTVTESSPTLTQVIPNTGQAGQQNLSVNITGQFTHFVQGTTTASFGAGVTVASLTVTSTTSATAILNINLGATAGPRRVTLTTGSEMATMDNAFTVQANPNHPPQVSAGCDVTVFPPGAQVTFAEYSVPATGIATGPDCSMWFTEGTPNKIGRLTTAGVITHFSVPTGGSGLNLITSGPDGNLWFTEELGNNIGQITTAGVITEFPIPTASSFPQSITTGPDGALWFTEQHGNKIGRITTAGVITEFLVPTNNSFPTIITRGPDSNLWFTEPSGNKIGRITNAGVITEFSIPTSGSFPVGIAAGPDGNLWFTECHCASGAQGGQIGRITTAGVITEYPVPSGGSAPDEITAGKDGNLWFTEELGNNIGRITTAGAIAEFPVPTIGALPVDITLGPEGNLWFTEAGVGKIGRANAGVFLTGSVTDDGLPVGTTLTTAWSETSGPGPVSFGNPTATFPDAAGQVNSVVTSVSFSIPGTYTLTLTGSDSQLSNNSNVTVTVIPPPGVPGILSVNPNTGQQGQQNLSVNITGQSTHFAQGTSQVNFGAGITINSVVVASPTAITVNISVASNAALGARTVTVTTGAGVVSLPSGFSVVIGNQPPIVSAGPNQTLTLPATLVTFTEFSVPTSSSSLNEIASGPDGALWFDEHFGNKIGRITTTGTITEYPIPTANSQTEGITLGPDGNLWFTESLGHNIGRITAAGVITEFPLASGSAPEGIRAGPDGNVWFTERFGNKIGKITPAGVITEYPIPTASSEPRRIAAGPDGNLWFTEGNGNNIARITPAGVITEYSVPSPLPAAADGPFAITAGPDGNLWFTETAKDKVGRITVAGTITEFATPTVGSHPLGITAGPDGNVWFIETYGNQIARITPGGVIMEFQIPTATSGPVGVTTGPDCKVWFTEDNGNKIGKVVPGFLPLVATITGSITDDGLPTGATLSTAWSASGGACRASLGNPTATFPDVAGQPNPVVTSATFSAAGSYTLTLTGSDSQLTASAMATITVNAPQGPAILFVNPNAGQQGQNLSVTITSQLTHFTQGTTTVSFGTGISVGTVTVTDANHLTAQITIDTTAALGGRNVTVTTASEIVSALNGFSVQNNAPTILSVVPSTGQQGQQSFSVVITGQTTHFAQGPSQVNFGAGITIDSVVVASATRMTANISIASNAILGARTVTVTTGAEVVSLPSGFSVVIGNQPPIVNAGSNQAITLLSAPATITEYPVPTPVGAGGGPEGITTGSDGNLWFTENLANKVGKITPAGVFTEFSIPGVVCCSGSGGVGEIVAGPDGNLWFTEYFGSKIWRVTTAGVFTPFPLAGGRLPTGITAGPDGNLWFVERFGNNVGRITTSGVITEFPIPTAGSEPQLITSGSDGNLWFTEYGNKIGRITTTGVVTEFSIPTANSFPYGITAGSDGNLWFTETAGNKIGKITPMGVITEFAVPSANSEPAEITVGPDGNLWFAEQSSGVQPFAAKIGRITPAGAFTEFALSTGSSRSFAITAGPDCNLWFTEIGTKIAIGRITPAVVLPVITTLTGSVADDGLPAGALLSTTWSTTSGPASVLFGNPTGTFPNIAGQTNPVITSARFCRVGSYVTSLAASDSLLSSSSNATITVNLPQTPAIIFVNPNTGERGQSNLSVSLTGDNTHFAQGTTTASFGAGITVVSLTVTSPTTAAAVLNIDPVAAAGSRTVTLTTGAEIVSLANGFTVTAGAPILTTVSPSVGRQGQSNLVVTIAGQFTHFAQGTTIASFGAGITVTSLTINSPTSATALLNIDPSATTGTRNVTLTTSSEIVSLNFGFTVTGTSALLSINPNAGQQGQNLTATINGQFTNFASGVTTAQLGQGISIGGAPAGAAGPVTVLSSTTASAQITIAPAPVWTQLNPTGTGPGVLGEHSVVYSQAANQLIIFGGSTNGSNQVNTLWRLRNANGNGSSSWEQITTAGPSPAPRQRHSAVYDAANDRMIVFGGLFCFNDVWVLANATGVGGAPAWTQLTPAGSSPSPRNAHTAVYDPSTNRMIVFGGNNCFSTTFDDTWVLSNANGLGGTPTWTQLSPGIIPSPGPTSFTGAGYDPASNRLVLLGGVNRKEIWILKNANGLGGPPSWMLLPTTGGPSRGGHATVYDQATNRLLITTGQDQCEERDNWILENANGLGGNPTWRRLDLYQPIPAGRAGSPLYVGYDNARDTVIVMGGDEYEVLTGAATRRFFADTWILKNALQSAALGKRTVMVSTGSETVTAVDAFTVIPSVATASVEVSPVCGIPAQPVSVTILGNFTNFAPGVTQASFGAGISVGGAQAGSLGPVSVVSNTEAVAQLTLPAGTGLGFRTVNIQTGSEQFQITEGFAVRSPSGPILTSVSPNSGQVGQTLSLIITGQSTNFAQNVTQLDLGPGIAIGAVTVQSPTSLIAQVTISSSAQTGSRNLSVTTGPEFVSAAGAFTVLPASGPLIISITPNSGQAGQGGPVSISGQNTHFLQGVTQLDFGPGITVSSVTVTCATCLSAQIALATNAPLGGHTVTATTGAEVAQLLNGFTVLAPPPFLTSMVPASGHQGQTVTSTITAQFTNWVQGTTSVSLGAGITINSVTVSSPTNLTVQLTVNPTAALGIRNLTVTTGAEVVSANNVFNVLAGLPQVTVVNPPTASQGQTNLVVSLTGLFTNWAQGTSQVNFGAGITVNSVSVATPTSLTVNISVGVSATPGARAVAVTTGAEVASLANAFTLTSVGTVLLSVSPNAGQQGQSGPITITGQATHFVQGTTQVSLGAGITVSSVTVTSGTMLNAQIAVANNAAVGNRNVTVTTGGEVVTLVNGFAVQAAPPIITVINPSIAQLGQTLSVGITAQFTNFVQGTTQVSLGAGITVNTVTVSDPNNLTAQVTIAGNAALGTRTVTATTGAEVVSAVNAFNVVATGGPALQSVTPNTGVQGQSNISVAIVGSNTHFVQGQSQATFGSAAVSVNSITVADSTHLAANISIALNAAPVARTVVVTTGAEVAALANAFTVQPAVNQSPAITIAPTWSVTLPSRLLVTYTVTDDGLPLGGSLTVSWDTITTPAGASVGYQDQTVNSISVGFDTVGTYTLRITATDTQFTVSKDITVNVSGNVLPPPTVSITSPVDGAEVTSAVNVIGTVGTTSLANWVLEYQLTGDPGFTQFATGTTTVTNGVLGSFDPSLLVNGLAYIRLRATDTSNQTTTSAPISLVLDKNQKIGNFTVSFNDLSVPVAGLPIQIVRTYDSRRRSTPGTDFSYGWTLDINTVRATESVMAGDFWNATTTGGAFPTYCLQPARAHLVTVSLPDGTTYSYNVTLTPQCQQLVPIDQVAIGFTARPGTTASLSVIGSNLAFVEGAVPGPVQLFDDTLTSVFDTLKYRLTLPDGRMLDVNPTTGLEKMTDLNGNTLTVTSAGITHSSGKSVVFTRNAAQLITRITDPAGNAINYTYNALTGNLTGVTDRSNQTTTFTYDATHGLLTIVDPRGVQPIRNVYDNSGRLIQHIDAFGNVINYTHNLNTRQEVVTDRLNNVTVNEYDTDGNVTRVTDALGGITQRTYDSRGNVLTETSALGQTRSYTYDSQDNRPTETNALGRTTTYTYNNHKQVLTVTDALGHATVNTYSASGNLLTTQDPSGNTTTYTYNASGLQTSATDPLGGVTSSQYDSAGNLTQQTNALGNVTNFTYDANGNRLSQTKTRTTISGTESLVTTYQYDQQNRPTITTYPDGSTTQVQYNAIGKQSVTIDQLGRQTSYQYDLMGRLVQTTFPDATSESSAYDAEGRRISSTDRAGRTTNYLYDALGRLTRTTFPDLANTTTTYDAIGEVTRVTDARGNATQYGYDAAGRRTSVTDALTHVTTFAYDFVGNQISMTDANSNTTQYQYDNNNRRLKTIYPDATNDTVAYDALGRTIGKTDQAGRTTQFQYDKLGRLTQVNDALNQLTRYSYDEVGNRISQTDANNHITTFAYDKLGRRTRRTLPLGMLESETYDLAGNLRNKTDFDGKTTTYTYDSVNRLSTKTPDVSLGEPTVSFTYTATGQRLGMVDASGTTSYTHDTRDRLVTKATPQGTLTYTYDLQGNLATVRSSNVNGTSVDYSYDAVNRLATAKDNRLTAGTTSYSYDAAGNLGGYLYPNGVQTSYTYNVLNRLTNMTVAKSGTLASYAYTLGAAGNRTRVVDLGGRQVDYTYDALYRLTNETITSGAVNGAIGYTYDAVGNRLTRTSTVAPVPAATNSYDANDRLLTDTYDPDGNTTTSGSNTYTYDFENHLKTQAGGAAVTIVYDGDGNRVAKTAVGVTTKYLVDDHNLTGFAQVLEETVGGTVQRVYTYGLGRISQSQASGTSFYGYDGHGNVRILTDATGAVTDRYEYDAFGNLLSQIGTTPNVYLYSGEQLDPNVGFYYLRARYYKPDGGRFFTPDSWLGHVFEPSTLHRYAYTANNPVGLVDPSGRQFTLPQLVLVSLVIGWSVEVSVQTYTGDVHKAITAGLVATLASFLVAVDPPALAALVESSSGGISRVTPGGIGFTRDALVHVVERHTIVGNQNINASIFSPGEALLNLLQAGSPVARVFQVTTGNYQRIITAGRYIGIERATGMPTDIYTIITDVNDVLVTMFPGLPLP